MSGPTTTATVKTCALLRLDVVTKLSEATTGALKAAKRQMDERPGWPARWANFWKTAVAEASALPEMKKMTQKLLKKTTPDAWRLAAAKLGPYKMKTRAGATADFEETLKSAFSTAWADAVANDAVALDLRAAEQWKEAAEVAVGLGLASEAVAHDVRRRLQRLDKSAKMQKLAKECSDMEGECHDGSGVTFTVDSAKLERLRSAAVDVGLLESPTPPEEIAMGSVKEMVSSLMSPSWSGPTPQSASGHLSFWRSVCPLLRRCVTQRP